MARRRKTYGRKLCKTAHIAGRSKRICVTYAKRRRRAKARR